MSDNENYDSDDNSVKSDDSYVDKQMKTTQPKKDISMFGDDGSGDDDDNDSDNENVGDDEDEDGSGDEDDDNSILADEFGEEVGEVTQKKRKKTQRDLDNEEESLGDYLTAEMEDEDDVFDDDDDPTGEQYMQKFDDHVRKNIVETYHQELLQHNHDEVEMMCVVVRNEQGIIVDPLHKTLPFLTKYEKARILGERAKQINTGSKPLIPIRDGLIDGYLIALQELEQKKIPFIIKRPLNNGGCEYWKIQDLEMII